MPDDREAFVVAGRGEAGKLPTMRDVLRLSSGTFLMFTEANAAHDYNARIPHMDLVVHRVFVQVMDEVRDSRI